MSNGLETERLPVGSAVWHCPLSSCGWTYAQPPPGSEIAEVPSAPAGNAGTLGEAIEQGAFAVVRDWYLGAERVIEAHLKTHSLVEWAQEVQWLHEALYRAKLGGPEGLDP